MNNEDQREVLHAIQCIESNQHALAEHVLRELLKKYNKKLASAVTYSK